MKTKQCRFLLSLLAVLLLFCLLLPRAAFAEEAEDPPFSGSRTLTYEIDTGLLPNYLSGGRTALDTYLRAYQPDWLTVTLESRDRMLDMTLSFSFETMQDYKDKLQELSLRIPVLLYTGGERVTYGENLTAPDLLSFLRTPMMQNNSLGEMDFAELFRYQSGSFQLNGQDYEATSPLCIDREPATMTASGVSIQTTVRQGGVYDRTVLVTVPQDALNSTTTEMWNGQMEAVSDEIISRAQGTAYQYGVTFTAENPEQLSRLTMQALNVPVTASETMEAVDNKTVNATLSESIDLSGLLQEDGQFGYVFSLGQGCDTLQPDQDLAGIVVENSVELADPDIAGQITLSYHRPFGFSGVQVTTDLTDPLGRLRRSVLFTVPLSIAEDYHQAVSAALSDTLVRGQTLVIYDTSDERCYEIQYASWFPGQFAEMTQAQFDADTLQVDRALLPYLGSSYQETLGKPSTAFAESLGTPHWKLILPEGTTVREGQTEGDGTEVQLVWQDTSRRTWVTGIALAVLVLLVLILILVLVLVIRRKLRRRGQPAKPKKAKPLRAPKAARRERVTVPQRDAPAVSGPSRQQPPPQQTRGGKPAPAVAPQQTEQPRFCRYCGGPIQAGQQFCARCGKPVH